MTCDTAICPIPSWTHCGHLAIHGRGRSCPCLPRVLSRAKAIQQDLPRECEQGPHVGLEARLLELLCGRCQLVLGESLPHPTLPCPGVQPRPWCPPTARGRLSAASPGPSKSRTPDSASLQREAGAHCPHRKGPPSAGPHLPPLPSSLSLCCLWGSWST